MGNFGVGDEIEARSPSCDDGIQKSHVCRVIQLLERVPGRAGVPSCFGDVCTYTIVEN